MTGAGSGVNQVDSPGRVGSIRTPQVDSGNMGQCLGQHVLRVVILPHKACGEGESYM